jgi:hypothetical protein
MEGNTLENPRSWYENMSEDAKKTLKKVVEKSANTEGGILALGCAKNAETVESPNI